MKPLRKSDAAFSVWNEPSDPKLARNGVAFPLHLQVAAEHYTELEVELDPDTKTFWCFQQPRGAPSYTPSLLRDLSKMQRSIKSLYAQFSQHEDRPIRYFVVASRPTQIFNLGGDLKLLTGLIRTQNRFGLGATRVPASSALQQRGQLRIADRHCRAGTGRRTGRRLRIGALVQRHCGREEREVRLAGNFVQSLSGNGRL
jgi:hypothetical protein